MFEKVDKPESVSKAPLSRKEKVKSGKQGVAFKDNRAVSKRINRLGKDIQKKIGTKQFISGSSSPDTSLRVLFRNYDTSLSPSKKQAIINYLSRVYGENITVVSSKPDITIHSGVSDTSVINYGVLNSKMHIGYNSLIYGSVEVDDISGILNIDNTKVNVLEAGKGRGVDIVIGA